VDGYRGAPEIAGGHDAAYYSPTVDLVCMPDLDRFRSSEDYYATLFHELIHSTGHASRLGRDCLQNPAPFGSPDYSREELIAEFGAAFLCGHAGIFPRVTENQAAYIDGWLRVLKQDRRLLPIAASQAQKAADWILGTTADAAREEQ
jgi:antirestriction protein ArdC